MTPREVNAGDVRSGDRVRWDWRRGDGVHTTVEGEVSSWTDASFWFVGLSGEFTSGPGIILTLLDRPLPPIPTTEGTVIQYKHNRRNLYVRQDGAWWCGIERYEDAHMAGPDFFTREHYDVLTPEVTS